MVQKIDEQNDDLPSNTLELFHEFDEIMTMIRNLKSVYVENFEKSYEKYSEILSKYQEQPHLLDKHMNDLLDALWLTIRNADSPAALVHAGFKYLYQICKVRTFKVLIKYLPHELSDLDFVLELLEAQEITCSEYWETRYMLLLWMSILVLNPFHLSRLDAFTPATETNNGNFNHVGRVTKMERIYQICKNNCQSNDTCSGVAAFLSAKYLIRTDTKELYLPKFFEWVAEENHKDQLYAKYGQLAAVAAILKYGKREDLIRHVSFLLSWITSLDYKNSSDFLKYKFYIKIIQRIGMVCLPPRLALWRYQRGSRSITTNLGGADVKKVETTQLQNMLKLEDFQEDDDNIEIPDEIEEVIEELLQALKSASSDNRWLAAKGIGRITNRLPKSMGDDVVGSVVEVLNPLECHEAWHGACLALAELAKRGLLLPYRLPQLVPLLLQALNYDEVKGYVSVGQHIRDAACYMSWAFARAYNPDDLQPFVVKIAGGLLITTVFDREINCRRAASAAFQESVGRLGNFPHGIDILTTADFYSVGVRSHAFLEISDFVAQFDEYTQPLIDHLLEKKVNHWDAAIRELTAKTLQRLTKRAPAYMVAQVLPDLFAKTDSIDINSRHGSILAIGEIAFALVELSKEDGVNYFSDELLKQLNELVLKFQTREQFRGMSGEMMKKACLSFIENCCRSHMSANPKCIESWQWLVDKCIVNKTPAIREHAVGALFVLCDTYYHANDCRDKNAIILDNYLVGCANDLEEWVRMGYVSAVGALPKFMLKNQFDLVLKTLISLSLVPGKTQAVNPRENIQTIKWSEARRDSVKALSNIILTVGFDEEFFGNKNRLSDISSCLLNALKEYTLDNRGDIGAWVRETAMNALYVLLTSCPHELLDPSTVHEVMIGLAQQSVEKIDRTRGLAGKLFCNLVHHSPEIPHIKRHEFLKNVFPQNSSKVLWLFADHTFPLFCSLLELPEYSDWLMLGLSASIGQLTESLIKYSSAAFFQYLRANLADVPRIGDVIVDVFRKNLLNERVTYPMLNFLDITLSSGTLDCLLMDDQSVFADEIYNLVNMEVKGHKKLYKLVSSINVYCHLIQVPRLCSKILSKMSIFLGLTHVHIRKSASLKLYEALVIHGDTIDTLSEENLDEVLELLTETEWGQPLTEIRPVRNKICDLLGVKAPVSAAASGAAAAQ